MSGTILSVIQAAGQLFAGQGTVTLGPVQFTEMELPVAIPIGGKQATAVHELPGGQRIINVLGPQEGEITWKGMFIGQNQSLRARTLDSLRQSGAVIRLAWDVYSYQVIVTDFSCKTRISGEMPYAITCLVVSNNSNKKGTTATDLLSQVTADLASGSPLGALSALSQGIALPVGAAQAAALVPNALTVGSSAFSTLVNVTNTAAGAVNSALTAADGVLAPLGVTVSGVAQAVQTIDTGGLVGNVLSLVSSSGDIANLAAAQGFIQRAAVNIQHASA